MANMKLCYICFDEIDNKKAYCIPTEKCENHYTHIECIIQYVNVSKIKKCPICGNNLGKVEDVLPALPPQFDRQYGYINNDYNSYNMNANVDNYIDDDYVPYYMDDYM